ncbi:MAG: hypothetical protein K5945_11385 [Bacteroidaceae bacterium]|nr:hypothetical protein [Bacteroidaceae bacterium]
MKSSVSLHQVLRRIAPWLDERYPGWVVFGSAALWLNGFREVKPHDIDILTAPPEGMEEEWDEGQLFRCRRRTKLCVEGIEVDISEGLEIRRPEGWLPVSVEEVVEREGLRYASFAECLRLMRLFDREKDRERLRRLVEKDQESK